MRIESQKLQESIMAARQAGDVANLVELLFQAAMAAHDADENAVALEQLQEAVALARTLHNPNLLPQIALAHLLRQQADWEQARQLYQEALRTVRGLDLAPQERDKTLGQIFLGLGRIFEAEHKPDAAHDAWQRSLGFFRRGGHKQWVALLEHLMNPS